MATTENGIYYPNDYSKKADVPDDMKKMAESIDPIVVGIKQNIKTLQQEQQTQNKNISNLQKDNTKNKEDITELQQNKETVNTQLETLQEEIKELEQDVKANAVIEETEKEKSLYISDASGARGRLDVLGNVEQEVTETSPSINYPSPLKILGDNINVLDDKKFQNVKIENSASISSLGNVDIELKNTTYCARIYFTDGTYVIDGNLALYAYNSNNTSLFGLGNTGATRVTNAEQVKYVKLVCNSTGIETYKGKTIKGIKIEEGETPTSYSPYNQGSTKISKINKNLFDKSNANILKAYIGQTSKKITVGTYHRTIFLKVNSGDTYTIKKHTGIGLIVGQLKEFPKIEDVVDNFIMTGSETPSITAKILDGYNYLVAYVVNNENNTEDEILNSIQIEKGTTATELVEHQEQNYILDIQKPMLKWDYFDLERKKEVHVTNKIILDGTKKFVVGNPAGRYYLDTELNNLSYEAISNCFKQGTENTFNVDNTIVLQTNRINLMNKEIATAEEFDNAVLELYNAGTPIEIYYPTTEPTELDLTESQIQTLEQLNKLRLYKGVNNIFTLEDIALLQATYSVDIQTKLNNINNQLLEMGGSKKRRK